MKLDSPELRKTELYFRPAHIIGWRLGYGRSQFLFAEGPGMTSEAGYDLLVMLADGREIEKNKDGTFFVKSIE